MNQMDRRLVWGGTLAGFIWEGTLRKFGGSKCGSSR